MGLQADSCVMMACNSLVLAIDALQGGALEVLSVSHSLASTLQFQPSSCMLSSLL